MWFLSLSPALATTLTVGPGQPFPTIGAAAAAAVDGDVVEILAGVYVEDVVFRDAVTVIGVGDVTIRATGAAGSVVDFRRDASIENVTVDGAGVARGLLSEGNDLTVTRCTFVDGVATALSPGAVFNEGGGVFADGSFNHTVTITGSAFVGNSASYTSGALKVEDAHVVLSGNTFEGNSSTALGVVLLYLPQSVEVLDNTFVGNAEGALSIAFGPALNQRDRIEGNVFFANTGTVGAGLSLIAHQLTNGGRMGLTVVDNLFVENSASTSGGAVHLAETEGSAQVKPWTATVARNTFLGNTAPVGATLYGRGDIRLDLRNNLVASNTGAPAIDGPSRTSGNYNLYFDNVDGDLGPRVPAYGADDVVGEDPALTAYSADGDLSNDDLTPLPGSPLIDAGDPSFLDVDGTRSDIGSTRY